MVRTTHWPSAKLSPQQKAIVAAHAVLNMAEGKADERAVRSLLVNEIGLAWSPLNCLQYLSGKEATAALTALPDNWKQLDRNKSDLLRASVVSLAMVKEVRGAGGGKLSGAKLAERLEELRTAMGQG
ncbi:MULTISPECIES: hypothetical protein [Xanthomonas]|uniref:Uncharacterized protein n=1 Tax=Xanthomonas nasturtii TaxID=1843581 RepID=A0A3E1KDV3_9XANT|nr:MULTISPECIES: hypothetical protein [Xanthomonas]ASW44569.1 hypothetical protein XJ27_00230 [Xanthomonas hortorum]MCE4308386.1 hypothetical protein [Xanthomonas hortorum pv. vitians]MCE4313368.1 hypothetical protein [Xanthomonas hortorum pv. vitians]MCE4338907.1 hypothetical protein [Xanthomonas hortorum pv. vitians]MCE4344117.1 hypothetical protein [Xanthomonas hortorum pv. vitians]